MRVFWAIMGVLLVAAAAWLFSSSDTPPHPAPGTGSPAERPSHPPAARGPAVAATPPAPITDHPPVSPPIVPVTSPTEPPPPAALTLDLDATLGTAPVTPPTAAPVETPAPPVVTDAPPAPSPAPPAPTIGDHGAALPVAPPDPASPPEPLNTAEPPAPDAPAPDAGAPSVAGVRVEPRPEGGALIDGRFIVKGEGTKEKPYEITWDLLLSAQEVYDPRTGRTTLPGRVMMLDEKYVTLPGHVTYPLGVPSPRELLSMMNQWDGCCIGIPPTPYDAVEVRLRDAATADQRLVTFGVVSGRFLVKPYLVGDWLVGLYMLEEATLEGKQFGGFGS